LQISENLKLQFIKAKKQLENSYNTYLLEKRNKKLAQKIYINYQEKYKAGTVSSLELTQAQLQYLNSEQSYFQTIFNLLDAKNKLDQALGL
jgi:outer membrane protein TolC